MEGPDEAVSFIFQEEIHIYIYIHIHIYMYVTTTPTPTTTSSPFRDLVFSFTGAKFKQAQTPTPNPYNRYAFSRGRKDTPALNQRSANFLNPRAPLFSCETQLALNCVIMNDTHLCEDTHHVHAGKSLIKINKISIKSWKSFFAVFLFKFQQ